jgi:tetratricopeptide (TPR) repeat protein
LPFLPKKEDSNSFYSKIVVLQSLAFLGAFFLFNPLLSMPTDWDLFAIPAVSLMVAGVCLSRVVSLPNHLSGNLLLPTLGIAILSLSTVIAHSQAASLSDIYTWRGMRSMKTYWIGSSTTLHGAASLVTDPQQAQAKRLEILEALRPYAIKGVDTEYADLLAEAGNFYYKQKDFQQAIPHFEAAYEYDPLLIRNTYFLVNAYFMLKAYSKAHALHKRLISFGRPSRDKAFRIAIHVAVMAGENEDALEMCNTYVKEFPQDTFIKKVKTKLEDGATQEELRQLFSSG